MTADPNEAQPPAPLLDLESPRTIATCRRLTTIALLLGIGGRIFYYLSRPSYWNDEAAVVVNVMSRTWRQLLRPLDYAQAAPPLFLWTERGLFRIFGSSEYALRSFPLLVSILGLLLFARLAWRLLPPTSAAWSVGFLALFSRLIHISGDVKQYGCDVLVSTVLLLAAFPPRKLTAGRRAIRLCAVGAVAIWFSFPAVFVAGALSLALLPGCIRAGRRTIAQWITANAALLVSFLTLYRTACSQTADPYLFIYWADSFPNWKHLATWLPGKIYGAIAYPFDVIGLLAAVLVALGLVSLVKLHRARVAAALSLTLALAFIAAAIHRYPFPDRTRLSCYLLPFLFLVLGAAAEGQNLRLPPGLCRWWWTLPMPLLLLVAGQFTKSMFVREQSSTIRPVVAELRQVRRPDEPIYLFGNQLVPSRPSGRAAEFLCYWPHAPGKVTVGFVPPDSIPERRYWIVYSLRRPEEMKTYKDVITKLLGKAHVASHFERQGQAGAILVVRE